MDTGKRQHLQDIYASDQSTKDDYTPQVSSEIVEERKRDARRHQFTSFFLGIVILTLSVALVYVVVREYIDINLVKPTEASVTREYIPRYSLENESQWVLDFSSNFGNPEWNGEGERPFTGDWIKKAAYNLILAEQAAGMGQNKEAASFYEDALAILPDLEDTKTKLGIVYFKMDEFDKALELLENIPSEELTPDIFNNLGAACLKAKAYDKAEDYLKQALEQQPSYPDAIMNLAVLYKEQERGDDAVKAYMKYLELRPTETQAQYDFALYLTKLGRWEQASEHLYQLTKIIPDEAPLYFLLAQVEANNNRLDKALAAMQRGMQLSDPKSALGYMDKDEFKLLRESDGFQSMIKSMNLAQ